MSETDLSKTDMIFTTLQLYLSKYTVAEPLVTSKTYFVRLPFQCIVKDQKY